MSRRKIIVSQELKEILLKINSQVSTTLLLEEVDETLLSQPEKNFNYLDLSTSIKGHLSYLTQEKMDKIDQQDESKDYWNAKMRYHARPGSVVKKIFNSFKNHEIEHFTTQFLSIVDPPIYTMKVVSGADIAKYYNYTNYSETRGSLGSSCMSAVDEKFFDIYVNNPDSINMLVMLNQHDKVMGRAIIWIGEDFKVLDRVYVSNDLYTKHFTGWAKENNCYYKEYNNWYTPKHMKIGDDSVFGEFEIKLNISKFDKYPYLDSFKWLNLRTNKITNFKPKTLRNVRTLSDHMGGFFKADYFDFCGFTNNLYLSCDITWLPYIQKNAYIGDIVKSNINNVSIYSRHAKYDNVLNDYIFNDEFNSHNNMVAIEKKRQEIIEINDKKEQKNLKGNDTLNPCEEVLLNRPWIFVAGRDFDRDL